MLDNLLYSVNAIFPIFLLVIIGAILGKCRIITDKFTETADWIVFKIALPIMLFSEVAGSKPDENIDWSLVLFLILSVTFSFFVVTVIVCLTVRDISKRGALIQGICRSNFAILGVPLAVNMFGEIGGQTIAITMPFVIVMFNSYSVIILSLFSESKDEKMSGKKVIGILKNVITNPLIIGVLLGIIVMVTDFETPQFMSKTLSYLANLATPLALLSLGANFKLESLHGRLKYAVIGALFKTVVLPAAVITLAALIGFRGPSLGVILICFGAPTAVSSYIMAKKMGNDHELAAQILLLSTFICILTVFLGIFILKTLSLI
jgi:malate permease and related proteins